MRKTTSKLLFDLNDDIYNFELISLYSIYQEDYVLGYSFNSLLSFQFKKKADLSILKHNQEFHFSNYSYYDNKTDINYYLIANQSLPKETKIKGDLLFETASTHLFLLPEYKNYNYLLKAEPQFANNILLDLHKLKSIVQYNFIDTKKLKDKENLILSL